MSNSGHWNGERRQNLPRYCSHTNLQRQRTTTNESGRVNNSEHTIFQNVLSKILHTSLVLIFTCCRQEHILFTLHRAKEYVCFLSLKHSTYRKIFRVRVVDYNDIHIVQHVKCFYNESLLRNQVLFDLLESVGILEGCESVITSSEKLKYCPQISHFTKTIRQFPRKTCCPINITSTYELILCSSCTERIQFIHGSCTGPA